MASNTPNASDEDINTILQQVQNMAPLFQAAGKLSVISIQDKTFGDLRSGGTALSDWYLQPENEQDKKVLEDFESNISKILKVEHKTSKDKSRRTNTNYVSNLSDLEINRKNEQSYEIISILISLKKKFPFLSDYLSKKEIEFASLDNHEYRLNFLNEIYDAINFDISQTDDDLKKHCKSLGMNDAESQQYIKEHKDNIPQKRDFLKKLKQAIVLQAGQINTLRAIAEKDPDFGQKLNSYQEQFAGIMSPAEKIEFFNTLFKTFALEQKEVEDSIRKQNPGKDEQDLRKIRNGDPQYKMLAALLRELRVPLNKRDQLLHQDYEALAHAQLTPKKLDLKETETKVAIDRAVDAAPIISGVAESSPLQIFKALIDKNLGLMDLRLKELRSEKYAALDTDTLQKIANEKADFDNAALIDFLKMNPALVAYLKNNIKKLEPVFEHYQKDMRKHEIIRSDQIRDVDIKHQELETLTQQIATAKDKQKQILQTQRYEKDMDYHKRVKEVLMHQGFWTRANEEDILKEKEAYKDKTNGDAEAQYEINKYIAAKYDKMLILQNAIQVLSIKETMNEQDLAIDKLNASILSMKKSGQDIRALNTKRNHLKNQYSEDKDRLVNEQIEWLSNIGLWTQKDKDMLKRLNRLLSESNTAPGIREFYIEVNQRFINTNLQTFLNLSHDLEKEKATLEKEPGHLQNLIAFIKAYDAFNRHNKKFTPYWTEEDQKKFQKVKNKTLDEVTYLSFITELEKRVNDINEKIKQDLLEFPVTAAEPSVTAAEPTITAPVPEAPLTYAYRRGEEPKKAETPTPAKPNPAQKTTSSNPPKKTK